MARARSKKGRRGVAAAVKKTPRIISRPAVLPPVKESVTRTLLAGIDALGEQLRRASDDGIGGRSTTAMTKGEARTIWVAHMRQRGEWDWSSLHTVFTRIQGMKTVYKDISDKRLAFARMHYVQYDDDGEVRGEGWYAPSPLTTWNNLTLAIQTESDDTDSGSRARRYENTVIDEIIISFASRSNI